MSIFLGAIKSKNKKDNFTYTKNEKGFWYFRGFDDDGYELNVIFEGHSFKNAKKLYKELQKT